MKSVGPCLKCGGRMAAGFSLEHTHGGATQVDTWHPGEPVKSF